MDGAVDNNTMKLSKKLQICSRKTLTNSRKMLQNKLNQVGHKIDKYIEIVVFIQIIFELILLNKNK